MRRTTILLAATALLALVLAACSGDGDALRSEGDDGASTTDGGGFAVGAPAEDRDSVASLSAESAPQVAGDGAGSLDLLGRTIIRNGSLSLEVESVSEAFDAVNAVAIGNGGFVADSSFFRNADTGDGEGSQFARMTLRVPAERFQQTLDDLRALAIEVRSVSTSSQDVTGEVTDLESDLRNLRAVEAQYLELLGRAGAIGDILQVQDRLTQTRSQIERVEGRIALLGSLADLATLQVELRTPPLTPVVSEGGSGPLHAAGEAWAASLATLGAIATVGIVAVVYSWWLLPLVIVVALALRRWPPRRLAARYD